MRRRCWRNYLVDCEDTQCPGGLSRSYRQEFLLRILKFLLFLPLAAHRRRSDPGLVHGVRIVATQHEDCGPCVQIAVNAALDDGMEPPAIRAVLDRNHGQMPGALSLAVRFAEGVLAKDGSEEAARDEIESQLGATVLTELSLAIASTRVFPTI